MGSVETITILFTDLVGSTELSSRVGPEVADRLRIEHFGVLRAAIWATGGREVKNLGDGLMVAFSSAAAAVECGRSMQQQIERRNRVAEHPFGVRIGVSMGDATCERGDYFGPPVVEAARLCGRAGDGQILLSEVTRAMVGRRGEHRFAAIGEMKLKGLDEPVAVCELCWEPLPSDDAPQVVPGGANERAMAAFSDGRWQEAFDAFGEADAKGTLDADDLDALGEAAWWLRRVAECVAARERAFAMHLEQRRPRRAASVALKLFYTHAVRGDSAIATGWLRRAARLLETEPEGVEHGHLRLAEARIARGRRDPERELACAREAVAIGRRFIDADLVALGQYIEGRILVRQGEVEEGMAILDEAMVAAAQGELDLMSTGQVYCNVIAACQELGDLRRAGEWTEALRGWSSAQPVSVFPGLCRVHRAEVMHLRGAWTEAEEEARRACDDLLEVMPGFAAEGFYEIGEVRRRLGDLAEAETAFRRASELGREPYPGLALVRLAQGRSDAASGALRGALAEESGPLARAKLLPAHVDVAIACGDLETARRASTELDEIAAGYASPALEAAAALARGAVDLAAGDAQAALPAARRAWQMWQAADCPFEAAQARRLVGRACRAAGDEDGAELALSAAHTCFQQLGASLEAAHTAQILESNEPPAQLTTREG